MSLRQVHTGKGPRTGRAGVASLGGAGFPLTPFVVAGMMAHTPEGWCAGEVGPHGGNVAMQAVVKRGREVRLAEVPCPVLTQPDDVLLRVLAAGVCRTDVGIAEGTLPSADPVVLGHEFAGVV